MKTSHEPPDSEEFHKIFMNFINFYKFHKFFMNLENIMKILTYFFCEKNPLHVFF